MPCYPATSAGLLKPAPHIVISNVSSDRDGVHFHARPIAGAARFESAKLEIVGPGGTIDQPITLETIPNSENSAPVCEGGP